MSVTEAASVPGISVHVTSDVSFLCQPVTWPVWPERLNTEEEPSQKDKGVADAVPPTAVLG